jgi:hypothetical protein
MNVTHRLFAATVFGVGVAVIAAGPALGLTAPVDPSDADSSRQTWAVVPASPEGPDGRAQLEYVAQPGTAAVDHVAVRNFGTAPLTVELYAQDAATTSDGSFDLLAGDETSRAIGNWIALDTETVTIEPRSAVIVPFTIDIPADAEPGDHAGGIVAVNAVDAANGSSTQYRVGTRVYTRVAGAVDPALTVERIDGAFEAPLSPFPVGTVPIGATLVNTGNIRLTPEAVVRATSLFGWWTAEVPLSGIPEILPDAATAASAVLDDVPALGPLWVTVDVPSVTSSGQELVESVRTDSVTVVVWAVPWIALAAIALLLLAAVVAVVNLRRRHRASRAAADESDEPAPAPDAVEPAQPEPVR